MATEGEPNNIDLNGTGERTEQYVPPVDREPAPTVVEKEPEVVEQNGPYDEKRRKLYDKAKEVREKEEIDAGFRAMPDDVERSRVSPLVETLADREAARAAKAAGQSDGQPVEKVETRRRLTVNGKEIDMTEEQIIAAAQKGLAAEDVLGDAKRLKATLQQQLSEVQAALANQQRQQQAPAPSSAAAAEDTKPADEDLDEVIDSIQVGSKEEAAAALRKYGDHLENRILERMSNIDAVVDQRIQKAQTEGSVMSRIEVAAGDFLSENPEFTERPALSEILISRVQRDMETEMLNVGLNPAFVQRVMVERGVSRGDAIAHLYKTGLANNAPLPDYKDLLTKNGNSIRSELNIPKTARPTGQPASGAQTFVETREARKAAITPQPLRSSVSPGSEASMKNEDDRRRDAIHQRRMFLKGRR